jgi:hypothetical protein
MVPGSEIYLERAWMEHIALSDGCGHNLGMPSCIVMARLLDILSFVEKEFICLSVSLTYHDE